MTTATTGATDASAAGAARHAVFHPLRVADVERLTDDAVAVTFDVPAELADHYRFVQGQHITVRTDLAGDDVRRNYSICAPVSSGRLRIAVKRLAGGAFSAYALDPLAAPRPSTGTAGQAVPDPRTAAMRRADALTLLAQTTLAARAGQPNRLPERHGSPIRVIVPYAAGGSTDTVARIVAPRLSQRLAQQVIIVLIPPLGAAGAAIAISSALVFETIALVVLLKRRLCLNILAWGRRG